MRKKISSIIAALIVALTFSSVVLSQEAEVFDYKKAYGDHVFNLQVYMDAHDQYLIQRDKYLQFETLASKTEANNATREMLNARDESLRVYLSALRMKAFETDKFTVETKTDILSQLDIEIAWYETQKNKYVETDSLEDLVNKSKETASRYETHTLVAIYNSLLEINSAEVLEIRTDQEALLAKIEDKTSEIQENGDKSTQKIVTWIDDVKKELEIGKGIEQEIKVAYYDKKKSSKDIKSRYNSAVKSFELGLISLDKVDGYFKEILLEIKTAD